MEGWGTSVEACASSEIALQACGSLKASTLVFDSGYDRSLQRKLEGCRTWILVYLYPIRISMRIPSARRPRGPSDDPAATGVGKAVESRSTRPAAEQRLGDEMAATPPPFVAGGPREPQHRPARRIRRVLLKAAGYH